MKLNDLLTEGPVFRRSIRNRDEFAWHGDIKHKKRLEALKHFLEKYPVPSLIKIYKQAAHDREFDSEGLKRVKRFMMQHRWDPGSIELMSVS